MTENNAFVLNQISDRSIEFFPMTSELTGTNSGPAERLAGVGQEIQDLGRDRLASLAFGGAPRPFFDVGAASTSFRCRPHRSFGFGSGMINPGLANHVGNVMTNLDRSQSSSVI